MLGRSGRRGIDTSEMIYYSIQLFNIIDLIDFFIELL